MQRAKDEGRHRHRDHAAAGAARTPSTGCWCCATGAPEAYGPPSKVLHRVVPGASAAEPVGRPPHASHRSAGMTDGTPHALDDWQRHVPRRSSAGRPSSDWPSSPRGSAASACGRRWRHSTARSWPPARSSPPARTSRCSTSKAASFARCWCAKAICVEAGPDAGAPRRHARQVEAAPAGAARIPPADHAGAPRGADRPQGRLRAARGACCRRQAIRRSRRSSRARRWN